MLPGSSKAYGAAKSASGLAQDQNDFCPATKLYAC